MMGARGRSIYLLLLNLVLLAAGMIWFKFWLPNYAKLLEDQRMTVPRILRFLLDLRRDSAWSVNVLLAAVTVLLIVQTILFPRKASVLNVICVGLLALLIGATVMMSHLPFMAGE